MTSALEHLLGKIEEDLKNKRNLSPVFTSAEKMDRYLDSL